MGRKKKQKKSNGLKILYVLCAVIVFIAGIYYKNGYTDVNEFLNDLTNGESKLYSKYTETSGTITDKNAVKKNYKTVKGTLEMHIIDVGQRR